MPSFGAYTGGLSIRDAHSRNFPDAGFIAHVLGDAVCTRSPPRAATGDQRCGARTTAVAAALCFATLNLAGVAAAAEIKIMVPAPMRTSMVELLTKFESTHAHKAVI